MNDATFQFWIIAFFSAWFALVAAVVWLAVRTGKAIDDRHTRRIRDCDGARMKEKWTKITSDSELFDHDLCPHCMDPAELCDCQAEVNETEEPTS